MSQASFQLPADKSVKVTVTSDLTGEFVRLRGVFPPGGYYHKTVISLGNGPSLTFQTPETAITEPKLYGGPFDLNTGPNGLDVTVDIFEAESRGGKPLLPWKAIATHVDVLANAIAVHAEGHPGSQGTWDQRNEPGTRFDWNDTIVEFNWS